jgi:hypothetical protein
MSPSLWESLCAEMNVFPQGPAQAPVFQWKAVDLETLPQLERGLI